MMRRAGSGIVVTPRQAELRLCWHLHAMPPSGPPPGGLTAPCTHSRSNQIKPRNCACRSPTSMMCLPLADRSLISSKREHPITLFHSQPALIEIQAHVEVGDAVRQPADGDHIDAG